MSDAFKKRVILIKFGEATTALKPLSEGRQHSERRARAWISVFSIAGERCLSAICGKTGPQIVSAIRTARYQKLPRSAASITQSWFWGGCEFSIKIIIQIEGVVKR
jgi:hypothetical protein